MIRLLLTGLSRGGCDRGPGPPAMSTLPASSLRSALGALRPDSDSERAGTGRMVDRLFARCEPVALGRVDASTCRVMLSVD
jgi:hypothetical protein